MKYIYLLRAGKNHYKVGIAQSVNSRVDSIRTSNPEHVDVIAVRLVEYAESTEKSIHQYLAELRTGGGTEWFKLTPEQALEVCILMNKQPEIPGLVESYTLRSTLNRQIKEFSAISKHLESIVGFIGKELEKKYLAGDTPKAEEPKPENEFDYEPIPKIPQKTDEDYMQEAMLIFTEEGKASTSLLQRRLSIGYGRAARIMDKLERSGLISSLDGARPRVLLDKPNQEKS